MSTSVRRRWLALAAAATLVPAIVLAAHVGATPGDDSTLIPITPVRVLDTRDPVDLGLAGPFVSAQSQDLHLTGTIPTATGTATVVPPGATGVVLNVTVVAPTADGFISVRPADAAGTPSTSNLNFTAGDIAPNAVTVSLPTDGPDAGAIEITYDAFGVDGPTTDVLVDVVAYMSADSLNAITAQLATKADTAAVDAAIATRMPAAPVITTTHGAAGWTNGTDIDDAVSSGTRYSMNPDSMRVAALGSAVVWMPLEGPARIGATSYTLRSVTYCIEDVTPIARVDAASITGHRAIAAGSPGAATVSDPTDRTTSGCHTIETTPDVRSRQAFSFHLDIAGVTGTVFLGGVTAVWEPRT